MSKSEERDTYVIPPNFIEGGTIFGGSLSIRNVIEAALVAIAIGLPIVRLPLGLTTRIIILCITALPLTLIALIGIAGESLSSWIIGVIKFACNRRVLYRSDQAPPPKKKARRRKARVSRSNRRTEQTVVPDGGPAIATTRAKRRKVSTLEEYLPIDQIENGVIYMSDGRYLKILEVEPINFLLRNAREQRNIIYAFVSFLKISPIKLQIKVVSKRADIDRHLNFIRQEMAQEEDEKCRLLQQDYIQLIKRIGSREAVTRRFFMVLEYEPINGRHNGEGDAIASLETAARTVKTYLRQCGNTLVDHEDENEFMAEALYGLFNRRTSEVQPLSARVEEVACRYLESGQVDMLDNLPLGALIAPASVDFRHKDYVVMDGLYYGYLLIPSRGYKVQVPAGWLSLLVNAGEGIDLDIYWHRQPKDQVIQRVGQQIRINRSKIRETSDTNADFEALNNAIRSGYFLKEGMSNNEDFYYTNILITVTADTPEELEWRISETRKLLISQDLDIMRCTFREEAAFGSVMPFLRLDKLLYGKSKRNMLTLGVASCYPFTSYEVSDDNGILLGVNKHNNSLVIADFFNGAVYKNANICILGCTGAGKTFLLQLIALRFRRRHIQTFILAPIKGHEFRRACTNIGGAYIQISPAAQNCINVMEIRKIDHSNTDALDGPTPARSELASKIQQLHIFCALLIPDMSHEERQMLDEAMVRTYAEAGITHDNTSLLDPDDPLRYRTMPILGDLHRVLLESPETQRLAHILNRLVNGSAKSFNAQTNVDLNNLYSVLDLSDLTGDLLPVGMFVALDYIWDKVKEDRTVEKAVIVDELWELIGASSNRLAANFVLEVAKLIRAFGGSGIFATQDLNDFFALDGGIYGRGVINACKTKIILNLEDEEAQRVESILHLSENEIMAITHFERGSGLVIANNNNVTVEFRSSQLERELITTDRRELQELLQRKAQNPPNA